MLQATKCQQLSFTTPIRAFNFLHLQLWCIIERDVVTHILDALLVSQGNSACICAAQAEIESG